MPTSGDSRNRDEAAARIAELEAELALRDQHIERLKDSLSRYDQCYRKQAVILLRQALKRGRLQGKEKRMVARNALGKYG